MSAALLLRRAVPDDAPDFARLMAEPAVFGDLLQLPFPSEALWRARLTPPTPPIDAQGQGIGTALMKALCDYADQWAHILRIELEVFTDNAVAMALYRRFGFVIEGTHRGYALRNGALADVHSMARWHPNPPTVPAAGLPLAGDQPGT